jgi:predicted metal-binding membrane protein
MRGAAPGKSAGRLARRDTLVVGASLAIVTALSWWYILRLAADMNMGAMDMRGMRMVSSGFRMVMAPAREPWTMGEFALMFAMWAVMMIGMMTPSASPLVLLYARVGRQAASEGKAFAATGWFAAGYLFSWVLFSLAATASQWLLERAAVLSPAVMTVSRPAGAIVLIAAGVYQWSSLKNACLTHCQSPLVFLQHHGGFRRTASGSFTLGLHHGLYCVGCCWTLMALLFVGGVMNVAWIAGLAILVLLEKVTPFGRTIARVAGVALVIGGVQLLVR